MQHQIIPRPSKSPSYVRRPRVPSYLLNVPSLSPETVIAYDTFTGADGTNITSRSMNVGAGWTALAGTMTIVSNTATCQSATTTQVTECSRPDVTVYCDIRCGAANGNHAPSIILRAVDNNNYLQIYFSGDGAFAVYKKIAGSLTQINAGGTCPSDTSLHSAKVICDDTHILVYLDDSLIWEGDVTDLAGGTKFGVLGFVNAGNKDSFDNFRVTAKSRNDPFPGEFICNSLTDNFTQANTTRLNTFGWTEDTGTWEVSSNKATQTLTSAPTNGYVVSRDCGLSDVGLEVKITTPATGEFICGLAFRIVDKNHYIEAEMNTGASTPGFAVWYTNNSGAYVQLARQNNFDPANNTTYTMRVWAKGQKIIAELVEAGIKLICYSPLFMNATKVGLFEFRNATYANANLYDDFKIYNY